MSSVLPNDLDIVCFSLSRWDSPISSPAVSLAREFAKHHRVIFIEHPYSWKDAVAERRLPGKAPYREGKVTIITPPLVLPINFLSDGPVYRWLSSVNNQTVEKTLRMVLKEMNITTFVFINFFDPFFLRKLPDDIRPRKFVYQCMDDLSQVAYTKKHGVRLEEEIIRDADLTLCTSRELTRLRSHLSPSVHFHPNAANVDLFNTAFHGNLPRPYDFPDPSRPVIGFTGSIEYRTDFQLIRKLALANPDKLLYFVGPVYGTEHIEAGLLSMPNVVFAGARSLQQLPAYLQCFDCCIIPYKKNKLTRSIYPLKINEYLAAGKPIVTTNFSEDIESFKKVAYVAETDDQFIGLVTEAIKLNTETLKHERLAVARTNTWERRVADFWNLVNQIK